jgi:hypothetical protein
MVAVGKTGGICSPFPSKENEPRVTPGGLENGLEGILFPSFHSKTIPLQLSTDSDQPFGLLPLPVDAAAVHTEKDHRGKTEISYPSILKRDIHMPYSDIA